VRVGVLGAGAMGSLFGALLAEGGADVLLVDVVPELVARIANEGVTIRKTDGRSRTVASRATTDPTDEPPCDVLLVYVKGPATAAALQRGAALIDHHTRIVSLQNGWGNGDRVVESTGSDRVSAGVTYHSAAMPQPGVVAHTASGPTYLGPWRTGSGTAAQEAVELLAKAGLEVELDPDIAERIWRKLLLNAAANPVAALTGLASDQMLGDPIVMTLVDDLARETAAVARAEGQNIEDDDAVEDVRAGLRRAGGSQASMLQDVTARRGTEIDTINGAVADAGRVHGVGTPLNAALFTLVKGYEASLGGGS